MLRAAPERSPAEVVRTLGDMTKLWRSHREHVWVHVAVQGNCWLPLQIRFQFLATEVKLKAAPVPPVLYTSLKPLSMPLGGTVSRSYNHLD
jgi:hypothetical protein